MSNTKLKAYEQYRDIVELVTANSLTKEEILARFDVLLETLGVETVDSADAPQATDVHAALQDLNKVFALNAPVNAEYFCSLPDTLLILIIPKLLCGYHKINFALAYSKYWSKLKDIINNSNYLS